MILYFVNRNLEVLGLASTNLATGYEIIDDELVESVDSGVASLTATVAWTDDTRLQLEDWLSVGNYVLTEHNNQAEMFTIITSETDTADKAVSFYAEDAGLDLINEITPAFKAEEAHGIEWYIEQFLGDSDFEIGTNEIPQKTRTLEWDGTSTVTERIRSVATQFDNAEISYSFEVENLAITHKYINIWEKRGTDAGQELRLDRDINSFHVVTSIEDLYTGLIVTGSTPEGEDAPITLEGYAYDDGDIFVENGRLYSREGAERWGRMASGTSYIMGNYTYETDNQATLCAHAVTYLRQHKEPAVNYEIDIERGLEDSRIGDRINLVDDKGAIYVSARILELKTSVTKNKKEATLGEYLIKSSGISDKVLELAGQFAQLASDREFLYSISVSSSAGSYFIDSKVDTTLTASVLYGGAQITQLNNAVVKWYSGTTLLGTGLTYHVSNETTISITCKLERNGSILAEDYITLFSLEMVYQTADSALTKSNNSIASDTLHYLATNLGSGVTIQTAGWTTTPQTMTATNKYLWTYHTYTKANGTSVNTTPVITGTYGEKGEQGEQGGTGVGISNITEYYAVNNSTTAPADSAFSTTVQNPTASNRYLWNYEVVTYTNGTTKKQDKHILAVYGEQGVAGKGITSVTEYYAVNNSTTAPADSAFGTTIQNPTASNKYLWNYEVITYTDTTTSKTGKRIIGTYGEQGATGVGISAVQPQYYLSNSPTSLTGGSWSETLTYTIGKYIWTREKITYTNNTTGYSTEIYNSALTIACANSESALQIASDTEQHFWTTETGTDTGSHITEKTQEAFLANPQNGGANLLARSNGVAIRDGITELASFSADGITFDDDTPFVIGNSDAYILFDPVNNRIIIGGNNISLNGQKTLGETLSELGTLQTAVGTLTDELGNVYQMYISTTYTSSAVVHTAVLLKNGVDVSSQTPNDFEWSAKLTTGYQFIGNGRSITLSQSSLHYAHAVTVTWTRRRLANLLTSAGNKLRISTGNYLLGRTEY